MHLRSVKSVSSPPAVAALTALLAGVVLLVSACGQKGPLTLPAASSGAASAASAPAR